MNHISTTSTIVILSFVFFLALPANPQTRANPDGFVSGCTGITEHSGHMLQEREAQLETAKGNEPATPSESHEKQIRIVAYYFHGDHRCNTCRTIEQYSREAIEQYFDREIKEGLMEFRPVNIDRPENRHFIKDFQLYTRSLVITLYEGKELKKYKNLDEVWTHVRHKLKFYLYVKNEVERFVKETA